MSEHHAAAKDTLKAIAINGGLGVLEIVAGGASSSQALLADSAHNLGDAAGYGLNIIPQRSPETMLKIRRAARLSVCAGAAAVALYSMHELGQDSERPSLAAPVVAGAAFVATRYVHRTLDAHGHLSHSHGDNATHARGDMYCSRITLGMSVLAYAGLPHADEVGSLLVAGTTIWMNRPTPKAMNLK